MKLSVVSCDTCKTQSTDIASLYKLPQRAATSDTTAITTTITAAVVGCIEGMKKRRGVWCGRIRE